MASVSELNQRLEDAREFAKANPYTVGSLLTASVSVFLSGLAYFSLRAKEHPSTKSVNLPFHHFQGHVPAMQHFVSEGTWSEKLSELCQSEDAIRDGMITLCLPNILVPFIHYVSKPELIDLLFTKMDLPKSVDSEAMFDELLGNGIFTSSGEEWKAHRAITSRMFSMRNLKDFMFECSSRAAERTVSMLMSRMMVDGINSEIKMTTVDMFDVIGRFTLDSFVEISFGRQCESIEAYPRTFEFGAAFDSAVECCSNRFRDVFWKAKKYFNIGNEAKMAENVRVINQFVEEMLDMESRKQLVDETGVDKYDIISLFIRHSEKQLSEYDLRYIALSMIVAGRDTTRNLLAWCLALLCTSQQSWLEKVRDEINQIDSSELSYDDCQKKMRITECVLLETLRLYPSVIASVRMIDRDITLHSGIHLSKGEMLIVNHYAQGRNPLVYGDDACEFKPMRWWNEGLNTYPPSVFGAFHQAPRLCLGRHFALSEAKTFLFYFLRAFNYHSIGDKFPVHSMSILLNMKGGWKVKCFSKSKKKRDENTD